MGIVEQPNVEFTCPECGSHYWGTDGLKTEELTGHCHGVINMVTDCDFSWPRSDDRKYFGPVRFKVGDRVSTSGILENRDFNEEAIRTRRPNAKGTVTGHHDSHGLCYVVRHDDGVSGCYDPDELGRVS